MAWQGIEGHDEQVAAFGRALARGRLASTFLFVGPEGIGKRRFAEALAQALLCTVNPPAHLNPCDRCPDCVQVRAGSHPDLLRIARPAGRATIPVELFIGDDAHRLRTGLCHDISLRPFHGNRRIAIIDDADYLKQPEGSNCLLKTLEEPPPGSVLILIGTSVDRQLPTIRSRCQIIRFQPLPAAVISRLLLDQGLVADAAEADRLAEHSQGSLARAQELIDADIWAFRRELVAELSRGLPDALALARRCTAFIEAAGKEAAARRGRARQLLGFAVECARARLQQDLTGDAAAVSGADDLADPVARTLDAEWAAYAIDRSLEAMSHVERNTNLANWLECWLDDLHQRAAVAPVG